MTNEIRTRNKFVEIEKLEGRLKEQSHSSRKSHAYSAAPEVESLHQLFDAAVGGVNEQKPAKPQPKGSARMTHQELLAMKESSSKVEEPRVQILQSALHFLVKSGLTVKGWFVLRDPRRKVCQQIGHHCSHCGMIVSYQKESTEHPHRS